MEDKIGQDIEFTARPDAGGAALYPSPNIRIQLTSLSDTTEEANHIPNPRIEDVSTREPSYLDKETSITLTLPSEASFLTPPEPSAAITHAVNDFTQVVSKMKSILKKSSSNIPEFVEITALIKSLFPTEGNQV